MLCKFFWKLKMDIDKQKASPVINELQLIDILLRDPTRKIEILHRKTGKTYRLCLNSFRQLCYRDGNNVKLLEKSEDFELVEEDDPILPPTDTSAGVRLSRIDPLDDRNYSERPSSQPVSIPPTSMDILSWINNFNRMVDGLASRKEPTPPEPEKEPEVLIELRTNFRVPVPAEYDLNDLATKYVVAITQSIVDLKVKILPKANYQVKRLITSGLVKMVPGLMPLVERALKEAGYEIELLPPNGAYARLTASLDNEAKTISK
jgi:hypothetical protein